MLRSTYTLIIDDFPEKGKHLFFNTRTQGLLVIDDALKAVLDNLPAPVDSSEARKALVQLSELGFVVSSRREEKNIIEEWFNDLRADKGEIQATVLTTYACNFACPYCVEEGVESTKRMDSSTAGHVVSYISDKAVKFGSKEIFVDFYGGEPLLNVEALEIVAKGVQAFCRNQGIGFAFGMTTNGSLLKPELVDKLIPLGLKGVKVTLDGPQKVHDKKRPYSDGRGSFDIIVNNIEYASDKIAVNVGGNFDKESSYAIPELLDFLDKKGLTKKLNNVSFKPISRNLTAREGLRHHAEIDCVYGDPKTAHIMFDLRKQVLQKGFNTDPGVGVNMCGMVKSDTKFTIDPEGKIYKCPALVGEEEFSVGSIGDFEDQNKFNLDLWKRCSGCPYLPLCGDGCMYGAHLKYGDHTRLNCQKDYVEFLVKENLKLNYQRKSSEHN